MSFLAAGSGRHESSAAIRDTALAVQKAGKPPTAPRPQVGTRERNSAPDCAGRDRLQGENDQAPPLCLPGDGDDIAPCARGRTAASLDAPPPSHG